MASFSPSSTHGSDTESRPLIDEAMAGYVVFGDDCPVRLADAIKHSLLAPGKRLRPQLVLWASEACGCSMELALPAACAVEFVHTYSLIHDDLPAMDDDDMRRGRPSCHAAFDEATAVLAGDALLTRAFEILARDVKPPEVAARCCVELARAAGATGMVGGQVDDLAAEQTDGNVAMLERIHRRKTGSLIVVSLRLGALVAGAQSLETECLVSYGTKLGLAFQIVDDLLDHLGSESKLGKRTHKDVDRGKLTFPRLLGREESRRRATQLVDEACLALAPLGERAGRLVKLAHYVLSRNH